MCASAAANSATVSSWQAAAAAKASVESQASTHSDAVAAEVASSAVLGRPVMGAPLQRATAAPAARKVRVALVGRVGKPCPRVRDPVTRAAMAHVASAVKAETANPLLPLAAAVAAAGTMVGEGEAAAATATTTLLIMTAAVAVVAVHHTPSPLSRKFARGKIGIPRPITDSSSLVGNE